VYEGDRTHLYYAGLRGLHHDTYRSTRNCGWFRGALCRATWDTGRFWAAVHHCGVSDEPAILVTPPMDCQGKALHINAATMPGGQVTAELLDEAGKPIEGFTRDACRPFAGDEVNAVLTWAGQAVVPIRRASLRLMLHNAKLYGTEWRPGL